MTVFSEVIVDSLSLPCQTFGIDLGAKRPLNCQAHFLQENSMHKSSRVCYCGTEQIPSCNVQFDLYTFCRLKVMGIHIKGQMLFVMSPSKHLEHFIIMKCLVIPPSQIGRAKLLP